MTFKLQNWYIFCDETVLISLFYEQVLMSIMNNQLSQHTVWYTKYQTVLENMIILLL